MKNKITRRQFVKESTICIVGAGAILVTGKVGAASPDMRVANRYPELPDHKPMIPFYNNKTLFFNEHQYALVATLAALILPSNDDPGATEAGVVDYIDALVAESFKKQDIYSKGLSWIDSVSQRSYDYCHDFLSLSLKDQIDLLHQIEETYLIHSRPVSNFWERLDRKLDRIWDDLFGLGHITSFFKILISDTKRGYYYNPVSWATVGYYGPPQPVGYLNFADPPPSNNYKEAVQGVDNNSCYNCHREGGHPKKGIIKYTCTACHRPHYPWRYNKNDFHVEDHLQVIFPNLDRKRQ